MFKGIWQSVLKWCRSLLGLSPKKALTTATDLPPLTDPDYEYLFMQLLEGVSHGWQQPRAIEFFRKIKQRAPKSQWIAWMNTFGYRAVNSTAPNEELARRMIQLSDLDCSEVTSLAGDYGHQILGKLYGNLDDDQYVSDLSEAELAGLGFAADGFMSGLPIELPVELPATELEQIIADEGWQQKSSPDVMPPLQSLENNSIIPPVEQQPIAEAIVAEAKVPNTTLPEPLYKSRSPLEDLVDTEDDFPTFGEVPEDLRLGSSNNNKKRMPPPPPSGFFEPIVLAENPTPIPDPVAQEPVEEREISIEEFAVMLQNDPELLQDISKQLGIETTDPQVVVDTVIAQMQQQIANGPT
jgi:hypothetical protein